MAEAPVPDRPNIHTNASPGLKGPWGHADVLIRTMSGEAAPFPLPNEEVLTILTIPEEGIY